MAGRSLKYWLVAPVLLLCGLTLLYPIAQAFWYSLHDWNIARSASLGPFVGLKNYALLLTDDPDFAQAVIVSLTFTVLSVAATIGVALGLALLLVGDEPLEVNVRSLLVIAFAMSPALVGISWRFLLTPDFGAADALLKWLIPPLRGTAILANAPLAMASLVAVSVWHWAPYFMLTFVGALATIPHETIEAAEMDGAGRARIFFSVTLPQIRPVLAVAILLKVIFSVKMLEQVITMTRGGPGASTSTVANLVYETAFKFYDFGYAAAMAYLLAAVLLALAAVYAKLVFEPAPAR